jgi:transposase-like protein
MVEAVRNGQSQRSVARQFGVSLLTVQRWLARAGDLALDKVNFSDETHAPKTNTNRTPDPVEELVLTLRQQLANESDLGEFGAGAIQHALKIHPDMSGRTLPAVATINRILQRHGVFDAKKRVRRPPPAPGWYLPEVAASRAELDAFDVVQGLVIEGGQDVEVLNGISLHSGLVASWPTESVTAEIVRTSLEQHWRAFGVPAYAQFDNDTRFQGPHHYPDVIGTVIRLCLRLSVVPVFAPVHEMGFQAAIESYNNRWQRKVWDRFQHETLGALVVQSDRYVAAVRHRGVLRQEAAPLRGAFPEHIDTRLASLWAWSPAGRVIYIRRTDDAGQAQVLGHAFAVSAHWLRRLVRCEVDLNQDVIRFYGLRRSTPQQQPLLKEALYRLPRKGQLE